MLQDRPQIQWAHTDLQNVLSLSSNRTHDEKFQFNRTAAKQHNSVKTSVKDQADEAVCNVVGTGTAITAIHIIPIKLKAAESKVLTYAMLDTCSTGTFILEDVASSLGLRGDDT